MVRNSIFYTTLNSVTVTFFYNQNKKKLSEIFFKCTDNTINLTVISEKNSKQSFN